MKVVAWFFFAWVVRKMLRMLRNKLAASRFEREYMAELAREARLEEKDSYGC